MLCFFDFFGKGIYFLRLMQIFLHFFVKFYEETKKRIVNSDSTIPFLHNIII